jgi:hypothetical protein
VISFRYHIVSIIAVFLALALGIVVGTTALNGPITTDLRNQVHSLEKNQTTLTGQNQTLQSQLSQSEQFAKNYSSQIVKGVLTNQKVTIIALPGASTDTTTALKTQVTNAGGTVSGLLQLTNDYTDPKRAGDIAKIAVSDQPAGLKLPTDPSSAGSALLAYVLVKGQPTDLTTVLASFTSGDFLKVGQIPQQATMYIVVTSGTLPASDPGGQTDLNLISQLQLTGGRVLVAGDNPSATGGGVVALVRGDGNVKSTVSTVDNADTVAGQVATVLALADLNGSTGKVGHFGTEGKTAFPDVPAK